MGFELTMNATLRAVIVDPIALVGIAFDVELQQLIPRSTVHRARLAETSCAMCEIAAGKETASQAVVKRGQQS
jgi:hypothetical protein